MTAEAIARVVADVRADRFRVPPYPHSKLRDHTRGSAEHGEIEHQNVTLHEKVVHDPGK